MSIGVRVSVGPVATDTASACACRAEKDQCQDCRCVTWTAYFPNINEVIKDTLNCPLGARLALLTQCVPPQQQPAEIFRLGLIGGPAPAENVHGRQALLVPRRRIRSGFQQKFRARFVPFVGGVVERRAEVLRLSLRVEASLEEPASAGGVAPSHRMVQWTAPVLRFGDGWRMTADQRRGRELVSREVTEPRASVYRRRRRERYSGSRHSSLSPSPEKR